ncbi:hypothetical protein SAMN05216360_101393 [Methylobacterium phyllostachyos]|uniref:Uncharacterized protein n=1 Tax=Methylobacterium phyllostachyos TaxID=582672 RepID=A0A1G9RV48_9HYPH|nr:hypothetical protein [Methylobacterium phyllostachyos]SDM27116.1 hypothetical protein SAMN05216360_101393 [Methylobacterium phyllostachyos]
MSTVWYKRAYDRADLDPVTFEALPGAIPPGIYCEDMAAYRALLAGAREKGVQIEPAFGGSSLGGLPVSVATPEQAAAFQAAPVSTAKEMLAEERTLHAFGNALVGRLIAGMGRSAQDVAQEQVALEAEATRSAMLEKWQALKDSVYGPDGKVDVTGEHTSLRRVSLPEYGMHTETTCELNIVAEERSPLVGILAGLREQGLNRQQRRAAAARARKRIPDADLPACGSFHG